MTSQWIDLDPSEFLKDVRYPDSPLTYTPVSGDIPRAVRALSSPIHRTASIEFLYSSSDEDHLNVEIDSSFTVTIGKRSGRLYSITFRSSSIGDINNEHELWTQFLDALKEVHNAVVRSNRLRRSFWNEHGGPRPADLNYGATEQAMNYRRLELEAAWVGA
ncbi:MAG: hypothetical protein J0I17_10120 ['Candidatus Kapabacteria' thiocyanatum]|uniref:Uncharacterized protein n=1 Tax=Candidatus Kapaibacterium thiocyanatum TaxID=1895771 RepID=A0A1M3KUT4_9BACT|nr:hypothetical protein ['Candidatus Kapabacteria' thiocyanatum]OJX56218.1 MAG: hypothetical protein BGO89_12815 ['Candidatus Kapabacteria' thiocyanatum]